ncbi:MAG TPA: UDP-N-acetylglucosamine 2-epimerase (non-hydrolyzing) [Myxococcota bacterium]|nr:UDP-N-acetylglucosamine 2-epimerase (non-hydrolyzing) [Myxococcota bacterium]HPC92925.1 UDP-N-acetylglucosamine 2-epimerase (non-hydrolyzing) [Myxococcota bacterium]HRR74573.1 UDP-N-acetylglucosamine 2-epimerase (non-hydrolyzing) [Myxococcota bacterium]HRV17055.1 UDP-N-acetylglucosamine 2-epimerase (non-hydrolyzing) [Myxococcota bacterium]
MDALVWTARRGAIVKCLVVLGTRPEAIKLAPVILEAAKRPGLKVQVCSTGQHREMLHPMLKTFSIVPDYELDVMGGELPDVAATVLSSVAKIVNQSKPDCVVVQGDTTTTWAAAMAAVLVEVPVVHVEAGLRTETKYDPFPEEIHRRVVSLLADLHLAPTETAKLNLTALGIPDSDIVITGNPVVDAMLDIRDRITKQPSSEFQQFQKWFDLAIGQAPLVLVTAHRRHRADGSSFQALEGICKAISTLAKDFADHKFVFPVHMNPDISQPVYSSLNGISNVLLINPLPYTAFVWLLSKAKLVLTDSGGIQEEAPSFGVPVVVMRESTERTEGLDAGTLVLAGTSPDSIVNIATKKLTSIAPTLVAPNPFGDGRAAVRIVDAIVKRFGTDLV